MTTELTSKSGIKCDKEPEELDSPEVTKITTIRSTVTRVCEVITDLHFSVPMALSKPTIPEAVNGVLTLLGDKGDVDVVVEKWSFIKEGLPGWLDVKGPLKDGTTHTVNLMDGEPLTANDEQNGVSRPLSRKELQKYPNKTELTVVFKTSVDACCEEGPVITFPESKYTLRKRYRDMTDFNDQTFGKWIKGPGAPFEGDLSFQLTSPASDGSLNYAVKNYTTTINRNIGPILYREFDDLEAGTRYRFSVGVRRFNTADPTPKLSLKVDNVGITGVVTLTDPAIAVYLVGEFVASSNTALLVLHSHEANGAGNDYLIDYMLVEDV